MNIEQYLNQHVKILSDNGKIFEGYVDDYFYPEDNENAEESITIYTSNKEFIEFCNDDIVSIEITLNK